MNDEPVVIGSGPKQRDWVVVGQVSALKPDAPTRLVGLGVELVGVLWHGEARVFEGRCQHRGALLADGKVVGGDIVCGVHGWDYSADTGVSAYDPSQCLHRFDVDVDGDDLRIDRRDIEEYARRMGRPIEGAHPMAVGEYDFHDHYPHHDSPEEPVVAYIHALARDGLSKVGHHGPVGAMGVPRTLLPSWDSIQINTAQLAKMPLLDDEAVTTSVTLGGRAAKPLALDIPLFVSDMSFGALSLEAKTALARGAQLAGTGICSGEGGMLPEEQQANGRYFLEVASARFGYKPELVGLVQAVHLKLGQGAKTGTGGHLPGNKVVGRIAEVRGLTPGTSAISPSRFPEWHSLADAVAAVAELRELGGGIPIGVKMSAQRIEADIDAAMEMGVDYIILDGRGGGTGAAPLVLRDHISVPTIPALARARRHLDSLDPTRSVSLVITGGLRTAPDFVKALAMGADAIAVSNAALQAIGCVGMRACNTDKCPVGIATQDPVLRSRLPVDDAAQRLARFFAATVELMGVVARACGHRSLSEFELDDLTTFDREMHHLSGVAYGGLLP